MARSVVLPLSELPAASKEVSELVQSKIGPKGPDLRAQARKSGRRLPRAIRRDIDTIAEAIDLAAHPKLSRQIDQAALGDAVARVKAHLKDIDVADRRWGAVLSWLGCNVGNLLLLAVLVIALLMWRGFL